MCFAFWGEKLGKSHEKALKENKAAAVLVD
jgi:hypothetical protein